MYGWAKCIKMMADEEEFCFLYFMPSGSVFKTLRSRLCNFIIVICMLHLSTLSTCLIYSVYCSFFLTCRSISCPAGGRGRSVRDCHRVNSSSASQPSFPACWPVAAELLSPPSGSLWICRNRRVHAQWPAERLKQVQTMRWICKIPAPWIHTPVVGMILHLLIRVSSSSCNMYKIQWVSVWLS